MTELYSFFIYFTIKNELILLKQIRNEGVRIYKALYSIQHKHTACGISL